MVLPNVSVEFDFHRAVSYRVLLGRQEISPFSTLSFTLSPRLCQKRPGGAERTLAAPIVNETGDKVKDKVTAGRRSGMIKGGCNNRHKKAAEGTAALHDASRVSTRSNREAY